MYMELCNFIPLLFLSLGKENQGRKENGEGSSRSSSLKGQLRGKSSQRSSVVLEDSDPESPVKEGGSIFYVKGSKAEDTSVSQTGILIDISEDTFTSTDSSFDSISVSSFDTNSLLDSTLTPEKSADGALVPDLNGGLDLPRYGNVPVETTGSSSPSAEIASVGLSESKLGACSLYANHQTIVGGASGDSQKASSNAASSFTYANNDEGKSRAKTRTNPFASMSQQTHFVPAVNDMESTRSHMPRSFYDDVPNEMDQATSATSKGEWVHFYDEVPVESSPPALATKTPQINSLPSRFYDEVPIETTSPERTLGSNISTPFSGMSSSGVPQVKPAINMLTAVPVSLATTHQSIHTKPVDPVKVPLSSSPSLDCFDPLKEVPAPVHHFSEASSEKSKPIIPKRGEQPTIPKHGEQTVVIPPPRSKKHNRRTGNSASKSSIPSNASMEVPKKVDTSKMDKYAALQNVSCRNNTNFFDSDKVHLLKTVHGEKPPTTNKSHEENLKSMCFPRKTAASDNENAEGSSSQEVPSFKGSGGVLGRQRTQQGGQRTGVPPLPPRKALGEDVSSPSGTLQNTNKGLTQPPGRSVILPIMKDGVQVSHTHYYLLPPLLATEPLNTSPSSLITAPDSHKTTAPPSVGRNPTQVRNADYFLTHPQPSGVGGTLEANPFIRSGPGAGAHSKDVPKAFDLSTLTPILPQESSSVKPFSAMSSSSMFPSAFKSTSSTSSPHPAKGLPVSGLGNKPLGLTRPHSDFDLMASETQISAAEKVRQVQKEVHGVTSDECKFALIGVQWDVTRAVRDLKTEQLFQLGSASREHCENLLSSLDWNLELASSILLEQSQQ